MLPNSIPVLATFLPAARDFFCHVFYLTAMTPSQCRAARGLLNLAQATLAAAAGVSLITRHRFESEKSRTHRASVAAIQSALEGIGVVFVETVEGCGVWLRAYKPAFGDQAAIPPLPPDELYDSSPV